MELNSLETSRTNGSSQDSDMVVEMMELKSSRTEVIGSRRYKAINEHLYSDLTDEAVILNLANGKYYGLNAVGVAIWKAMQEPATVEEIESAIMLEFDVDQETCSLEISTFLEKMAEEQLVETFND